VLRLGFPVVGVRDLPRAVAFWTAALDLVPLAEWKSATWTTLGQPDGSNRALGLMVSDSPAESRPRVHLDLLVDSTGEQDAEVERLLSLGATRPDWDLYPPEPDFVVLADPDGNLFCIVDLSRAPSGA
jgi:catechol 2,3-dioxygenase-like lactoylglutathione lyase family enzyme